MKRKKPTYEELETRLAQAEETLRAIRRGEVDVIIGERTPLAVREKTMVEALRQSEEKYRALAEQSLQGVIVIRQDFRIVYANPIMEEITGYSRNELLSLPKEKVLALIHPEDQALVWGRFKDRLEGKEVSPRYEYRAFRKDGTVRWVEMFANRIEWEGEPAIQAVFIDITERKRAEEELKASEERYRALVESSSDAILLLSPQREIISCNQAVFNLYGYNRDEIIGKSVRVLHASEESFRSFGENVYPVVMREGSCRVEWELVRKDGSKVPVEIVISAVRSPDSSISGYVNIARDITERKRAEEALRESEERFRNIVEATSEYIWETNAQAQYTFGTEKMESIYGRPLSDILGHEPFEFMPPEEGRRIRKLIFEFASQKKPFRDLEHKTLRPDGTVFWQKVSGIPLFKEGEVVGYRGTASDITEQKRLEEELIESEKRFRELFDEAPVGYHELDQEGRIIRVNRTELEMLGYTAEEMLGRCVWEFVEERELSQEIYRKKMEGLLPPGRSFERTYRCKDGTIIPVLIEDRILRDKEGRITGVRSTIQNISDLRKLEKERESLEEQLRQAQKMEAIGTLAGGIAHDFNNILSVIKGMCQLSLLDLNERDPLYANLKEIDRSTDRAADLTRQLLAFSRKQILEPQVLDLNQVIQRLEKMLRRILGEDIELVTFLSDGLGRVKVDPGQIEQVIMNLVVNARDAMPRGGRLTLETANVELDEAYVRRHIAVNPGQYVMLSISDTGVGMSQEVKERVFEPFFTTKEKGGERG